MKGKFWYLIILVLLIVLPGCSVKRQLKKADRKFECGEYYAASEIYRKAQGRLSSKKQRKQKSNANFKLGVCYERTSNYTKAVRAYSQAVRYKCNDSTVFLNLAQCQMATGKYKDAKANYEKYLKLAPSSIVAQNGAEAAGNALRLSKEKTRYVVAEERQFKVRKGSTLSPVFADNEGSSLILTSNRDNTTSRKINAITGVANNDIFMTRKNNSGKWEEIEPIEGTINSDEDEGVATVSADGKTLYFTRCEGDNVAAQIWKSSRSGGEWTEPQLVQIFNDSTISCGHPALSPDGEKLYFVSDAEGSVGKNDIWVAYNNNGVWEAPTNLGATLNTEGNEMFPYVRHDGVLFFASDGHKGFGGLDIYMARQDSAENWTVTNMLMPINSMYDDFGITFSSDNNSGYFTSNRGKRKPVDAIYSFFLPEMVFRIEGVVVDEKGEPLGESTIRLVGNNGETVKSRTKKDGSYAIKINQNVDYVMMASHRGYLNSSHKFDSKGLKDSKIFENKFQLSPVSRPVQMDNIFFEFGKWTLTANSEAGLNQLVKLLNDNPNITIEISAHTDMVGGDETNINLSQRRAQSVVDYLVNAGIAADRITPKGYGESQPVTVSEELAKQHPWLKEGDVLSPEYIENLTDEQQETCNGINRRTEFKVVKTTYNLY